MKCHTISYSLQTAINMILYIISSASYTGSLVFFFPFIDILGLNLGATTQD